VQYKQPYKLGLKPVKHQPKLMLKKYLSSNLPTPPEKFGHVSLIQPHMFKNDSLGDCAIAGSIEEIRLLNAERKVTVPFSDTTAVTNYSAVTGYDPADPSTADPLSLSEEPLASDSPPSATVSPPACTDVALPKVRLPTVCVPDSDTDPMLRAPN
jgi:hypothetical protein